jgi:hypothetical protein
MTFIEHYLKAVRMYLPAGPKTDDIIVELSEHLQSKMEEREGDLGRPLTDEEQGDLLTAYGNPLVVAERYGAARYTVAFGWQIIGPELFPLYMRILALNWILTITAAPAVRWFMSLPPLRLGSLLEPLGISFVLVTTIFALVDRFQRSHDRKPRENWRFPPAFLQPVPRWQSVSGLVLFSTIGLWWMVAPLVPVLMFGRAADTLALAPSFWTLYWPVLLIIATGAAQRATTLAHPEWNGLQVVTRLLTNLGCLALLYPFAVGFPHIVVSEAARGDAASAVLAARLNSATWWIVVVSMALYWAVNAGFHAWASVQHARFLLRRRAQRPPAGPVSTARLRTIK